MNKFIIENKYLKISRCVDLHLQLVTDSKLVRGGGHFIIDTDNMTIHMYGKSIDFGKIKSIDELIEAINNTRGSWGRFTYFYYETENIEEALEKGVQLNNFIDEK